MTFLSGLWYIYKWTQGQWPPYDVGSHFCFHPWNPGAIWWPLFTTAIIFSKKAAQSNKLLSPHTHFLWVRFWRVAYLNVPGSKPWLILTARASLVRRLEWSWGNSLPRRLNSTSGRPGWLGHVPLHFLVFHDFDTFKEYLSALLLNVPKFGFVWCFSWLKWSYTFLPGTPHR